MISDELLNMWLMEHVMDWRWWRFHYTKARGGDGSQWQELVSPKETWPGLRKKWGGKLAKVKHPDLEDTTEYRQFVPTQRLDQAMQVLNVCQHYDPVVEMHYYPKALMLNMTYRVCSGGSSTLALSIAERCYGIGETRSQAISRYAFALMSTRMKK